MLAELAALLLAVAPPPEVAKPPAIVPAPRWRAPVPEEAKTPAGVRVAVIPRSDLPLVHLTVVIQAGSELDPPDRPGLAAALALFMEEGGAGAMSGPELIAAIDALGGELEIDTEYAFTRLSLTVLARHLERALQLLGDLIARPKLDPAAWERVKAHRIAELIQVRDQPREMANHLFTTVLLPGTGCAHAPLGTQSSVAAMTPEQLKAFWAERYGPRTVSVFADGNTTAKELEGLVESAFKGFTGKAAPPKPPPPAAGKPRWVLVDRPGAPQTSVRVGHLGIARTSPDWGAAALANVVLGGSFTSRLNQNLREAHGYTYGAGSLLTPLRGGGVFVARSEVRTDVTGPALTELLKELQGIVAPLSEADAGKGRALLTSHLVETIAGGWAGYLYGELLGLDLPLDLLAKLPEQAAAANGAALATAQALLFRPAQLTVVMIGDRKAIEPQLAKVPGALPVEQVDLDGRLVP